MVNRRHAGPTLRVTGGTGDLVAEERALPALLLVLTMARCTVPGSAVAVLACTLSEQLRKQLHGRFPLTDIDPPVGQDEP
ncbi:hypothetical protein ACVWXU_007702 [Streptomyces sp. TE33382]